MERKGEERIWANRRIHDSVPSASPSWVVKALSRVSPASAFDVISENAGRWSTSAGNLSLRSPSSAWRRWSSHRRGRSASLHNRPQCALVLTDGRVVCYRPYQVVKAEKSAPIRGFDPGYAVWRETRCRVSSIDVIIGATPPYPPSETNRTVQILFNSGRRGNGASALESRSRHNAPSGLLGDDSELDAESRFAGGGIQLSARSPRPHRPRGVHGRPASRLVAGLYSSSCLKSNSPGHQSGR
jgi:hypothetical protein